MIQPGIVSGRHSSGEGAVGAGRLHRVMDRRDEFRKARGTAITDGFPDRFAETVGLGFQTFAFVGASRCDRSVRVEPTMRSQPVLPRRPLVLGPTTRGLGDAHWEPAGADLPHEAVTGADLVAH